MANDPTGGSDKAEGLGPVKIEWNWDLDDRWVHLKSIGSADQEYTFGEEGRIRLKGRHRQCWGGLVAKRGPENAPAAIRCRVCAMLLEGDDAKEEYRRMSEQDRTNTFNMALGLPAKYQEDAKLVSKIFPYIDRQTEDEFRQRTTEESAKEEKRGWLTRSDFPAGSAGFLSCRHAL